jgi:hypothetical protein
MAGENAGPTTTRTRALIAGAPVFLLAVAALLGAPSPSTSSADVTQFRVVSATAPNGDPVTVMDAVALVVAPSPKTPQSTEEPVDPVATSEGGVSVSGVVMVVNDDGSATLSATFEGGRDATALKAVHVSSDAGELEVASTTMWLPILPDQESRAGDASDAGGFVVPSGLVPGQVAHLQLQLENGTCLAIDAPTVRRDRTHDEVFPTNGRQLGQGKQVAAAATCSAL